MPYAESTGRRPDFRVRYTWIADQAPGFHQRPFQHMRCDFAYEGDDVARGGIYMVWPEFEDEAGAPLPDDAAVPTNGTATMWIVASEMRTEVHRKRAQVGVRGFFMVGGTRIARAEIIDILGLHE
jgi:hypothetical protein